jgi:hypothetical protein
MSTNLNRKLSEASLWERFVTENTIWPVLIVLVILATLWAGWETSVFLGRQNSSTQQALSSLYDEAVWAKNEALYASHPDQYPVGAGKDPILAQQKADETYWALRDKINTIPREESVPLRVRDFLSTGPARFVVVDESSRHDTNIHPVGNNSGATR